MLKCPDLKCYKCLGKGHIARSCPQNNVENPTNTRDRREGRERKAKGGAGQAVLSPKKDKEEDTEDVEEGDESSDTSAFRVTIEEEGGDKDSNMGNIFVKRTRTGRAVTIEALDPIKETWVEVGGYLDSGATHTLAEFDSFGHLCTKVKPCSPIPVTLADKKTIAYASKEGLIELRTHVDEKGHTDTYWDESIREVGMLAGVETWKFYRRGKEQGDYRKEETAGITLRRADGDDEPSKKGKEGEASEEEEKDLQERIRQTILMEQLGLPSERPIRFKDPDEGDDLEHLEGPIGGDNIVIPIEEMEKEILKEGETYVGEEE
eukprot:snap_masked-scaffold_8-processed-gene-5.46-mRNA-1 protein AED:1.00 eAED:1.00 QI:0/0/0/0/1/1/3/0/319